MTRLAGWTLAACVALAGTTADAALIDTSGFAGRTTLLDTPATIFFDGDGDYFFADADGDLFVNSFLVTDPLNAALDFSGLPSIITGASDVAIMQDMIQFLFDSGNLAYLVTIDATGHGIDFTDDTALIDVTGQIILEELTPIPLPASLPLLLAALAGLGFLRRRA